MGKLFRGLIRSSSFFRKEIFEVLRQPRLVTTLILGPFLILFIFGIGYRDEARSLRTILVASPHSAIPPEDLRKYGTSVESIITFSGVTDNLNDALSQLHRGEVDLVVVEPDNAVETVKNSSQAVFTIYHREIDPAQVSYVKYVAWLYVNEVNQQVLEAFAMQGQEDASNLKSTLEDAHQNISALKQAIQVGDEVTAQQHQQMLVGNVDAISMAVGASLGLLNGLEPSGSSDPNAAPTQSTLSDLLDNTDQLDSNPANKDERLARLDKMDKDITDLQTRLAEFQNISPSIIVSPFRSETQSVASVQPSVPDFFAPAVLALLLQHLGVTFAALSIVRERNVGTMELFRVSPLSAVEALFGKYISYMLFGAVIATILSALLVFGLHVPMLGNWWYFALVVGAVLFTSLGIGFVISIISETNSQAVQYSMIVLLASVFFSGFIMSLDLLLPSVRIISWALPTTYGSILLRDIALRGTDPNWMLLGGLIAIGVGLLLLSWWLMHRLITASK